MEKIEKIETITAQATPPGRGGVGIIRLSGSLAATICQQIVGELPEARKAHFTQFKQEDGEVIDLGLVLYFPAPNSFTGEEVIEFHGHGGPVVMDTLLQRIVELGARLAKPGEFSQRAFLNGKLDLAQAEAIADLIDSASTQAARSAVRSLQGEFSKKIDLLVESLIRLRMYVEAAIDFPEEDVDFLADDKVSNELSQTILSLDKVQKQAKQGSLLREGMQVVIAGKPNAGKSSLLNCLSGRESAIVTEIPGTTRDLLREHILIDGIPLHIIDTAGLRESSDGIEKEGIKRAWQEIKKADRILLVIDGSETQETDIKKLWPYYDDKILSEKAITIVRNKIDKIDEPAAKKYKKELCIVSLSAKKGDGVDFLREHLKECVGAQTTLEGGFIARRRHLEALDRARTFLMQGQDEFANSRAGELLAENLRQAQQALGEITGVFTADDLLGQIFSSFCIGK